MSCYAADARGEPQCSPGACVWGCALFDHHAELRQLRGSMTEEQYAEHNRAQLEAALKRVFGYEG